VKVNLARGVCCCDAHRLQATYSFRRQNVHILRYRFVLLFVLVFCEEAELCEI
jgi:hypothetical protein